MAEKMKPVAWADDPTISHKVGSCHSAGVVAVWVTGNEYYRKAASELTNPLYSADQLAQARREERERCAKVLELRAAELISKPKPHWGLPHQLRECAATMRTMGDEE